MKVDIHIIPAPDNDHTFKAQLERLKHPAITVQVGQYVKGSIVDARCQGYALGTCPYVSWVDDDDAILNLDWIHEAVRVLDTDRSVSAVYPRWKSTVNGVTTHTSRSELTPMHLEPHHLTIMRRQNVLPMIEAIRDAHPSMCRWQDLMLTLGQLRHGKLLPFNVVAYEWKLREDSGRTLPIDPVAEAFAHAHMRMSLSRYR